MTKTPEKINVRVKFTTPAGAFYGPLDEIENSKIAYQDYVLEVGKILIEGLDTISNFTDIHGNSVFVMSEALKNAIVLVEKINI